MRISLSGGKGSSPDIEGVFFFCLFCAVAAVVVVCIALGNEFSTNTSKEYPQCGVHSVEQSSGPSEKR